MPDTVPAQAGLLVPPEDAGAFADALRLVLTDPARRAVLADASAKAGLHLPVWADTAAVMGAVLDQIVR